MQKTLIGQRLERDDRAIAGSMFACPYYYDIIHFVTNPKMHTIATVPQNKILMTHPNRNK